MLQVPGATSYLGCVGNDQHAQQLKEVASKDGVNVSGGSGRESVLALSWRSSSVCVCWGGMCAGQQLKCLPPRVE